jgi:hypothetical protein
MPAKGSTLKTGKRLAIVTPKFFKLFQETHLQVSISYKQFTDIINLSNELTSLKVIENTSGFKLPENLGYIAVTRYKSKRRAIDFKKTKELGQTVYHTNFHSYGYTNRIQWFSSQITKCKFHQIYKFVPERKVSRELAKKSLAGKVYNEFNYSHFKQKKIRVNLNKNFK